MFTSAKKNQYFPVDLAGGFGITTSTDEHLEGHPPSLAFSRRPLAWRPTSQKVGEWIAIVLENNPRMAIACVLYPSALTRGGERAYISAFKLSYTTSIDFYASDDWRFFINPLTESEIFPGLQSEEANALLTRLQPTVLRHVKLEPLAFVVALAVRWSMVFCYRTYVYI